MAILKQKNILLLSWNYVIIHYLRNQQKQKNGFDTKEIREILLQLNNVFIIMNENSIAHRDIKLNNILVTYLNEEKLKF